MKSFELWHLNVAVWHSQCGGAPSEQSARRRRPPHDRPFADALISRLLTHSIVDVYVGPEGTVYSLHEKLLCHHSPVLRNHFYKSSTNNSSYGLPDDDPVHFSLLVGWLYSRTLSFPVSEADTGPLLDLYLLAEKLQMSALERDCVDTVRAYYHANETYPELRRVQYIYENTDEDNPLREMMVGSVARFLTLGERIPKHWDGALRNNGQLAVDIIRAIQQWHLEGRSVPDAREGSVRGFSRVEGASEVGRSEMDMESRIDGESVVNGD